MSSIDSSATKSETSVSTSPASSKPPRRGKGSKGKAAERFRQKKNETVGLPAIQSRISHFNLEHGLTPEDCFGNLVFDIPAIKPVLRVYVTTHRLLELCKITVDVLIDACKVPSFDREADIQTVQLAACMQLAAKIYYARRNTPYNDTSSDHMMKSERIFRNIDQSILPIAMFIDQIGICECNGQKFIPGENTSDDGLLRSCSYFELKSNVLYGRNDYEFLRTIPTLVDGTPFPHLQECEPIFRDNQPVCGPNGGHVHLWIHDRENAVVIAQQGHGGQIVFPQAVAEYVELRPNVVLPTMQEVFERYISFISRIQKKVANEKLPRLNLNKGVGTVAQLVGVGQWVGEYREVWSTRDIPASSLYIGAAFELGMCEQPLTDRSSAFVESSVDTNNALFRLAQTLSQRLERK